MLKKKKIYSLSNFQIKKQYCSVLCVHLEGWDREMQEGGGMGMYVYVYLIHFVIQQKLTHHCKAIILQ